ncbi:hypothetical protein EDD15DRAFT_2205884 [Pisolithus albus]|nr:hypothetical protein EDD15DRAFT_2205884 [Pisolithus albus]
MIPDSPSRNTRSHQGQAHANSPPPVIISPTKKEGPRVGNLSDLETDNWYPWVDPGTWRKLDGNVVDGCKTGSINRTATWLSKQRGYAPWETFQVLSPQSSSEGQTQTKIRRPPPVGQVVVIILTMCLRFRIFSIIRMRQGNTTQHNITLGKIQIESGLIYCNAAPVPGLAWSKEWPIEFQLNTGEFNLLTALTSIMMANLVNHERQLTNAGVSSSECQVAHTDRDGTRKGPPAVFVAVHCHCPLWVAINGVSCAGPFPPTCQTLSPAEMKFAIMYSGREADNSGQMTGSSYVRSSFRKRLMGRDDQRSRDRFGRVNKVYMNSNLEGTSKTDLTQYGPLYRCTLIRACQIAIGYGPEGNPRFLIDRSSKPVRIWSCRGEGGVPGIHRLLLKTRPIVHGIKLEAGQQTETEFALAGRKIGGYVDVVAFNTLESNAWIHFTIA